MSMPNQEVQAMFRPWLVVLTSALFFFYIFIQMNLFNSINSALVEEFNFNAHQISQLFTFYSYGNILFLFPAGILLDRFSVRNLLIIVFVVSIIATYVFSTATTFWIMNFARLVIGLAGAFALLAPIKIASRWFEPRHMALVVGVVVSVAMLGGVVAQTPLTLLTHQLGWRCAVQLVVMLGGVLVALQLLIVRDEPKGLEQVDMIEHNQLKRLGFRHSLGLAIANKQNWLSGIFISLVNLPLFVFGGIWGVPYLTQVHHFNVIQASVITTMMFVGMMIGSPLAGWVSDRLGLRKLPMIVGAILSILVMLAIMFAPTLPFIGEIGLYLILGLVISSQVIGFPLIAESNLHSITATATSLSSILIMLGGVIVQLFGWLLHYSHRNELVEQALTYTAADFIRANYLVLIGLVIALLVALLVKETYCKQLQQLQEEQLPL